MRKRARQAKKQELNEQLLATIYQVQSEWKKLHSIIESSIDPDEKLVNQEKTEQLKYLYLLKEARHRDVKAVRY